jgi:hypothetical protein
MSASFDLGFDADRIGPRGGYAGFSMIWTEEELYAKYKLAQEEVDSIESMIKPMECSVCRKSVRQSPEKSRDRPFGKVG